MNSGGRSKAITTPIVRMTKFPGRIGRWLKRQLMIDFVSRLLALRREHPVLRCRHFLHGKEELAKGIRDIAWFNYHGESIPGDLWNNPDKRSIVLRRAEKTPDGRVVALTVLLNPIREKREFQLPSPHVPSQVLVNSGDPALAPYDLNEDKITLMPQSVVLLRGFHEGLP
jgi:isoamylase